MNTNSDGVLNRFVSFFTPILHASFGGHFRTLLIDTFFWESIKKISIFFKKRKVVLLTFIPRITCPLSKHSFGCPFQPDIHPSLSAICFFFLSSFFLQNARELVLIWTPSSYLLYVFWYVKLGLQCVLL